MLHHRGCVKVVVWLDVAAQRQGVIVRVNSRAKKFGRFGLVLNNPRFELTEVRARRCFWRGKKRFFLIFKVIKKIEVDL